MNKEEMREFILMNRDYIETFQWSVMNAVASLVYCEYLNNMKQMERPVPHVKVVPMKVVRDILEPDSILMKSLSDAFFSYSGNNNKYCTGRSLDYDKDELEFANNMHDVLTEYIFPNVRLRVAETIMLKFGLNTDQQMFREDRELTMFTGWEVEDFYRFLYDQVRMQHMLLSDAEKEIIEAGSEFEFSDMEVVVINNQNAICPICIGICTPNYTNAFNLIMKITNTSIEEVSKWHFKGVTSEHNQIKIVRKKGV